VQAGPCWKRPMRPWLRPRPRTTRPATERPEFGGWGIGSGRTAGRELPGRFSYMVDEHEQGP
jgi:hypothetical protein